MTRGQIGDLVCRETAAANSIVSKPFPLAARVSTGDLRFVESGLPDLGAHDTASPTWTGKLQLGRHQQHTLLGRSGTPDRRRRADAGTAVLRRRLHQVADPGRRTCEPILARAVGPGKPMSLQPGMRVGVYEIVALLGRGEWRGVSRPRAKLGAMSRSRSCRSLADGSGSASPLEREAEFSPRSITSTSARFTARRGRRYAGAGAGVDRRSHPAELYHRTSVARGTPEADAAPASSSRVGLPLKQALEIARQMPTRWCGS